MMFFLLFKNYMEMPGVNLKRILASKTTIWTLPIVFGLNVMVLQYANNSRSRRKTYLLFPYVCVL